MGRRLRVEYQGAMYHGGYMDSFKKYPAIFLFLAVFLIVRPALAITQKTEVVKINSGSKTVRYVCFSPAEELELRPVLAQNVVGRTEALASMAKRNNAVAAINGTFFNAYDQRDLQPMGSIMLNRKFVHFRGGATSAVIGPGNELRFAATAGFKIQGGINGSRVWPNNWYAWFINHLPGQPGEIVLFTPDFRTSSLALPNFTLITVSGGKVTSINKHNAVIPQNGFVIAYGPAAQNRDAVARFHVGDRVEYWIEFPQGLQQALHLLSAGPKLVTGGKVDVNFAREGITDPKITSMAGPRSFIGTRRDGTIVMGTVNSATVMELAGVVAKLGLVEAMNLDGGASSGLYYRGSYLTAPGRNLSNCLVVVPKKRTPRIVVNGQEIIFGDASPFIDQGVTMVPVRGVFEALGVSLEWDGAGNTVIARRLDTTIKLPVGLPQAEVNGNVKALQKPAVNRGGRVYIPLRFVSEELHAAVDWDPARYMVTITSELRSARAYYEQGMEMLEQGRAAEAMEQLELATRLDPALTDAWLELAGLYYRQGDYAKAVATYRRVDDERALVPMGWAAYACGQFDIAMDAFTRALQVNRLAVNGHYGLGVTCMHHSVNKPDLAIYHLQKVIELDPVGQLAEQARELLKMIDGN